LPIKQLTSENKYVLIPIPATALQYFLPQYYGTGSSPQKREREEPSQIVKLF